MEMGDNMKKIFALLLVLAFVFIAAPAFADWSVTVTWTRSVGPNLDHEAVLYQDVEQCSVDAVSPTSCQFVTATLGGEIVVRSYNSQGAFADTAPIVLNDVPAPASGVNINVTYVAP